MSDQDAHCLRFPLSPKFVEENSYSVELVEEGYPAFFAPLPRSLPKSDAAGPLSHGAFIQRIGFDSPLPSYTLTSYGISTCFPLIPTKLCFPPDQPDQPHEGW